MARIRTLKPECWKHRKVRALSREGRLFWVVLVTQADDEGRFQFLPGTLIGEGYPEDDDVTAGMIRAWMTEVENVGLAVTFNSAGDLFGEMHDWADHQKISKPTASRLPGPPTDSLVSPGNPGEVIEGAISPEFLEVVESPGIPRDALGDHGSRITDLGSGIGGGSASALDPILSALTAAGFGRLDVEQDYSAIRQYVAERVPPADTDWDIVGQRIKRYVLDGTIEQGRPVSALKFVLNGKAQLPRIGQLPTGLMASTTRETPSQRRQREADEVLRGAVAGLQQQNEERA